MTSSHGFRWAITAGTFAACASISAKFAMTNVINDVCVELMTLSVDESEIHYNSKTIENICYYPSLLFRISCFALIFLCNALMWTFYTKSIQQTSTLAATIINSSTNLFVTAIVGWVLFEEHLNFMWVLGASCIIVGLVIIQKHSSHHVFSKDKDT